MKKKFFLLIAILTAGLTISCGGLNPGGDGSKDGSGDNSSSQPSGDETKLPNTKEESANKLYQLANSQGVEIIFTAQGDGEEPDSETIGFKNNTLWIAEESAYQKDGNNIAVYEYDLESKQYVFSAQMPESEQMSLDYLIKTLTAGLYVGYEFADNSQAGFISSSKDVTFLGRSAKEYTYSYRGAEGLADINIIFDNETGVTLKVYAKAVVGQEGSSATYEITSFKVGNAVRVPNLVKRGSDSSDPSSSSQPSSPSSEPSSSSSQPGSSSSQPGEEPSSNHFVNHLLEYDSNVNANVYVNSSLALFEDGSFELSFTENKKLVAFLGKYTVDTIGTVATLVVEKIYKEQTKEYIKDTQTWTMVYAEDVYSLAVSANGIVFYKASNSLPTRLNLPADQGGSTNPDDTDAQYKVTYTLWKSMIEDCSIVTMESNFRVNTFASDSEKAFHDYYFDSGRVYSRHVDDKDVSEDYHDFTSGKCEVYYKDEQGVWNKRNDYITIASFNNSIGALPIPFSAVMFSVTAKAYTTASWTNTYGQKYTNIMFKFNDSKLEQIHFTDPNGIYHEHNFSQYGEVSFTLPEIGSGGQGGQTTPDSKWPASDIASKLNQIGVSNLTLPAPSVDEANIKGVYLALTNGDKALNISIELDTETNAQIVLAGYLGLTGFELDYASYDFDNGIYGLLNTVKDTIIKLAQRSNYVSVNISKYTGNPYPASDVQSFFRNNNISASLPSISMDKVNYSFFAEETSAIIVMSLLGDSTLDIEASAIDILLKGGLKVAYVEVDDGLMAFYLDPTGSYFVSFRSEQGSTYCIISIIDEENSLPLFVSYPEKMINDSYIVGMRDKLPKLEVSGAAYAYSEGQEYGSYVLSISMQANMDINKALSSLQAALAADFTLDNGTYTSKNGQIIVSFETVDDKLINVNIQFLFEEESVTYSLINDNDWDITKDDALIYAYVWKINGDHDWIPLEKGEDGAFSLGIDNTYIGLKVVRFAPDSDIDWREGANGSINPNVTIWNQTGDITLSGETSQIHFSF